MKRVGGIINGEPRIDVLINNAGALFSTRGHERGAGRTFATNHGNTCTDGRSARRLKAAPRAPRVHRPMPTRRPIELQRPAITGAARRLAPMALKLMNVLFARLLARGSPALNYHRQCFRPASSPRSAKPACGLMNSVHRLPRGSPSRPSRARRRSLLAASPEVAGGFGMLLQVKPARLITPGASRSRRAASWEISAQGVGRWRLRPHPVAGRLQSGAPPHGVERRATRHCAGWRSGLPPGRDSAAITSPMPSGRSTCGPPARSRSCRSTISLPPPADILLALFNGVLIDLHGPARSPSGRGHRFVGAVPRPRSAHRTGLMWPGAVPGISRAPSSSSWQGIAHGSRAAIAVAAAVFLSLARVGSYSLGKVPDLGARSCSEKPATTIVARCCHHRRGPVRCNRLLRAHSMLPRPEAVRPLATERQVGRCDL